MATRPLILKCPSCNSDLAVAKLQCHSCNIALEGDFRIPPLLRLSRAQMDFVEVFLKNRGNIREVERELGVSYPTVRARLDEVLDATGLASASEDGRAARGAADDASTRNRRAILEQLSAGKISAEDAMRALGASKLRNPEKSEREESDDE